MLILGMVGWVIAIIGLMSMVGDMREKRESLLRVVEISADFSTDKGLAVTPNIEIHVFCTIGNDDRETKARTTVADSRTNKHTHIYVVV